MIRPKTFTLLAVICLLPGPMTVAQEKAPDQNSSQDSSREFSQTEQQIRQFFQDYQKATTADSTDPLIALYDFNEMAKAIIELAEVDIPPPLAQRMGQLMRSQVANQFALIDNQWTRHRIMQIDLSEDETIADVFVRSWSDVVGTSRELYRLKKIGGEWRICDFSELSFNISTVAMAAMGIRDGIQAANPKAPVDGMRKLMRAITSCAQGDAYEATEHIDGMLGFSIPESWQSLRWQLSAAVYSAIDPIRAIEYLDKADAFGDPTPMADGVRGQAYLLLGRHEMAIKHLRRYVDQFGADADAFLSIGLALQEIGKTDEAIEAYQAALADTPESVECVEALALALPDERKNEFVGHFRKLPQPTEHFEYLGDSFVAEADAKALDALIVATTEIDSETPLLDYYRATRKHLAGDHEEAFKDLAKIISAKNEDDDTRSWQEPTLCDIARHCGKFREAYDICLDKQQAIRTLVDLHGDDENRVHDEKSKNAIRDLIASHLKSNEDDFEALMMAGSHASDEQQHETARRHFVKALSVAEDYQRSDAIYECIECYFQLDRPLGVYDDLSIDDQFFFTLEGRLVGLSDDDRVAELKKLDRERYPDAFRNVLDDLPTLLEKQEFQNGLDRTKQALAKDPSEEEEHWDREQVLTYQARFLIGLKRYDEALIISRQTDAPTRDFLRTLVFAAKGQREKFDKALQRCLGEGDLYGLEDFADAREIPADWIPESAPETESPALKHYSPYHQVRRIVFLLSEPRYADANQLIEATNALGEPLLAITPDQMQMNEDNYICALQNQSVVVSTENCRYFIQSGDGAFLNDAEALAEEFYVGEEIAPLIQQHKAWISIDIFQWPQTDANEQTVAIPPSASKRLGRLSRQLTSDIATVALLSDDETFVQCDEDFFSKLESDTPLDAFQ